VLAEMAEEQLVAAVSAGALSSKERCSNCLSSGRSRWVDQGFDYGFDGGGCGK
jgi:hypothetical protein